ncbi:6-phosphogluconolactonase [Lutimaribacter sp. EGI FJ00015]|uniref:6-phosphogluconolactonase n=1 Tax=Lutimaribacter degradans TaxID=2945989 RepID=A0ACC5ZSF6_9RHOB|nr:6-phosphogluconolactonase [Lutimaribacter sp. EGI FJ00013]MCM2561115.1 6-phosphogluconolactonase [Lutimaribacter sp. EGI FJ00013]MCO0611936.1 6-phosphogluconolactonase [Lutimaribacter sp. EGI FJ00015]MCO0634943.1 6-phosphogluconolactonase [Lutimaribacter sp. EGI FJ00014]
MKLIEYADRDMLCIDLANKLAGELTAALMHDERVTLIVPGGTTPGPVFDALCAADLEWSRVDVILSDERWVPEDAPASNARLLRERLLADRAEAARFHPFYVPDTTPEAALPALEEALAPLMPAAVALLGMGADMHTASLFPRGDNLRLALDPKAPLLVEMRAPGVEHTRVTLSARALADSLSLHMVINGADKREALERAMDLPPEEAPVASVLDEASVHWAE